MSSAMLRHRDVVRVRTEGKDLFSTVVYFGGIKTRFHLKSSGFSGVVVDVVEREGLLKRICVIYDHFQFRSIPSGTGLEL